MSTEADRTHPRWVCPDCRGAQGGRYCEADGYDYERLGDTGAPTSDHAAPVDRPVARWHVVATADRPYFDHVQAHGSGHADLDFPSRSHPIRRFRLDGDEVLIGRHSRTRGLHPAVDLIGPPEDLGVSRGHALLVAGPPGAWSLVPLESLNGTFLNDFTAARLPADVAVPLAADDRIYLGAWTCLTIVAGAVPPPGGAP